MRKRLTLLAALILALAIGVATLIGCSPTAAEAPPPQPADTAPEPEAAAEPEPEPEPEPVYTAWLPFNGQGVEEDDPRLNLRPLSVKIENTNESRPSSGLTYADVVYETITEGGITRFNTIFNSRIPDELGSVRSGRNSDVSIVPQYNGLFVFSGANRYVLQQFAMALPCWISEGNAGSSFYRVSHKSAPHNLYFNPKAGYERFEELGNDIRTENPVSLKFGENDMESPGWSAASEMFVPFSAPEFDVTWKYSIKEKAYFRYINGVAQVDESDRTKQVRAENVVVIQGIYASNGDGETLALNLNGEGDAMLFQNGKYIKVTWYTDGSRPPAFKDSGGNPILLKPGQTWFAVPGDLAAVEVK